MWYLKKNHNHVSRGIAVHLNSNSFGTHSYFSNAFWWHNNLKFQIMLGTVNVIFLERKQPEIRKKKERMYNLTKFWDVKKTPHWYLDFMFVLKLNYLSVSKYVKKRMIFANTYIIVGDLLKCIKLTLKLQLIMVMILYLILMFNIYAF